ncbi:Uncharacterised protein [Klebsiella pneumoniae]|nr:Uncharacterised protein [Klebsiella pneumoniae]
MASRFEQGLRVGAFDFFRIGFTFTAKLVETDDVFLSCTVAAQHLDGVAGDHFAAEHAEMAVEVFLLNRYT